MLASAVEDPMPPVPLQLKLSIVSYVMVVSRGRDSYIKVKAVHAEHCSVFHSLFSLAYTAW